MSADALQPILDEVGKLITLDGNDDNVKQTLLKLVSDALSKEQYINSIKSKLDEILKDKTIDASDIPNIMILSIQVNNILPQLLGLTTSIQAAHVKYIVYGSIIYYIKKNKPEFFADAANMTIDVFRMVFSGMWKLLEINPETIALAGKAAAKNLCGLCCGETPVKTREPVA